MDTYDWLNINKWSLSIRKTNVLLFNIINKNRNINLNLNINNIKVKQVSEIEIKEKINDLIIMQSSYILFLGIFIDTNLNWKNRFIILKSNLIDV